MWFDLVFLAGLVWLGFEDWKWQCIPFEPILGFLFVAIIWRSINGQVGDALLGALIGFAFFGAQYWIGKGKWLGDGDVWLGIAMGVWLGWYGLSIALYAAYVGGGLLALILLILGVWKRGQRVALVPFLALGGIAAVAVGWWT